MKITKTKFSGVYLIEPKVFADERGFFYESYNFAKFTQAGFNYNFVQDNHSSSQKGTLRGLHYQLGKAAQTKLVRCTSGEVLDVIVDLRQDSLTFKQWGSFLLSAQNKQQLLIPQGFAHGFAVLSESAEFQYKCDNFYDPKAERGIVWNDPQLKINWQTTAPLVSAKDQKLPPLQTIPSTELF